jgi:hypothetical protein
VIESVDEIVTNGNREMHVLAERLDQVHYSLIVCEHGARDQRSVTILVGLANVFEHSMGLVRIAWAHLMILGGTDFRPHKLAEFFARF